MNRTWRSSHPARSRASRRGMILPIILAVTIILLLLASALGPMLLLEHRRGREQEQRQQAQWIAEAALQRGLWAIRTRSDFTGESWDISADSLQGDGAARVEIEVLSDGVDATDRQLRVTVTYPEESARRHSVTRQITLNP